MGWTKDKCYYLWMNKEREGGQTSSRADGTVSDIAAFHHGAETCSAEGPNLELLKKVQVQNHKLHELTHSMKEKEEILLVS